MTHIEAVGTIKGLNIPRGTIAALANIAAGYARDFVNGKRVPNYAEVRIIAVVQDVAALVGYVNGNWSRVTAQGYLVTNSWTAGHSDARSPAILRDLVGAVGWNSHRPGSIDEGRSIPLQASVRNHLASRRPAAIPRPILTRHESASGGTVSSHTAKYLISRQLNTVRSIPAEFLSPLPGTLQTAPARALHLTQAGAMVS